MLADGEPLSLWVSLASVVNFLYSHRDNKPRKCMESFDNWRAFLHTYGLDPEHAQRSSRSLLRRKSALSHGFEPYTHDAMTTMDWRISAPGLTALLLCFSTSGRYHKELGADGHDRVRALLRGWLDNVLTPEGGPYVLGGPKLLCPFAMAP